MKRHLQALCVAATALALPAALAATAPLSPDAQALLQQVRARADNGGAPFMVVDKALARVWVFDGQAQITASSPVLLGLAVGDDSVPGIGERPMAQIKPAERTTPAGRFVLEPGRNANGEDILWVDYDAAVSMHRVRTTNKAEHRLERLASPGVKDNRISYGCINVPAAFYDSNINPVFTRTRGLVYVLPETRPVQSIFASAGAATGSAAGARPLSP